MHAIGAPSLRPESAHGAAYHGVLLVFERPADATESYLDDLFAAILADKAVGKTFRRHPESPVGVVGDGLWLRESEVDLAHHVRRATVAAPGDKAAVLELVTGIHEAPFDPQKPAWLAYLLGGLPDGQFALYLKVHQGLMDGVGAMEVVYRMLANDPESNQLRTVWAQQLREPQQTDQPAPPKPAAPAELNVGSLLRFGAKRMTGLANKLPDVGKALLDKDIAIPYSAPNSILNVSIGADRRIAARTWSMERVQDVRTYSQSSIDEVVTAMVAGALRSYLAGRSELPSSSLIALLPLAKHTDSGGVRRVGTVYCKLGTDLQYPEERLKTISASMADGRKIAETVGAASDLAASLVAMTPRLLAGVPGVEGLARPAFNLTITYVPGAREAKFWNQARLRDVVPIPLLSENHALGVAATFTETRLEIALVSCPTVIDDLEPILDGMEAALVELEGIYH